MHALWKILLVAIVATALGTGLALWSNYDLQVCRPDESCAREWIAATSGWAAVMVAMPTILYLSKQVRDADSHQRTAFAIQLRKQRILAVRTARIANVALGEMDKQDIEQADFDLSFWDRETVDGIIHHLRDGTISAFESEIAHPISIGGWGMALIFERGYSGIEPALTTAPGIARQYFKNLRDQADAYLSEVSEITRAR